MVDKPLSPLELRFVKEYSLDDSSERSAAIRAGYPRLNASRNSKRLMKDPRIIEALEKINNQAIMPIIKDIALTKERVLQELCLIAFSNMKDYLKEDEEGSTYIDLKSLSRDVAAPLVEVQVDNIQSGRNKIKKVKVKQADKMAALEKLGKHLGLFTDKLEVNGQVSLIDLITKSMKDSIETNEDEED